MSSQPATLAQLMDLMNSVGELTRTTGEQLEALRSVTLVIVSALAKQSGIEKRQLLKDVEDGIDRLYGQDEKIPMPVLDIRAQLIRSMGDG